MAAHLIEASDFIDVSSLSICIYGPPGTGKTTLAQTAANPITLDLDRGAHRSFNRQAVMRFDSWKDVEAAWAEIAKRQTVVVDTIGRCLDLLGAEIVDANAKMGTRAGGLSLQGYGALKARFGQWIGQLVTAGKDRVLIAHEKEERDGDDRIMRPDVVGGSYTELMKTCDLVGYLYRDRSGKRFIDFNPSDRHLGKNAAGWEIMEVPELRGSAFLADLIADAKARIGKTAEASAAAANLVEKWQPLIAGCLAAEHLNDVMATDEAKALTNVVKKQVWHLVSTRATELGLTFDKKAKAFVASKEAAA